jgi:voltage-gated potassium channel
MSSPSPAGPASEQVGPFQFAILVLSVLSLGAIAADALLPLPPEISRLLQWVDLLACGAFFIDFVVRFRLAESKLAFMKWGWIDLLASVPNVEALRVGRFVRLLRLLRLLRGVRSLPRLVGVLFGGGQRGGVASVGMIMFLLIVLSSVGVLWFERVDGANIRTAGDALWWSVTTVTTVGYGDRYPVTAGGRTIAAGLMVAGVGLFGALSGIVASLFLGQRAEQDAMLVELKAMRAEMERMRTGAMSQAETGRREPPSAAG